MKAVKDLVSLEDRIFYAIVSALVLNFPSENSAFLWQYGHEVSVDLCDPGLGSC